MTRHLRKGLARRITALLDDCDTPLVLGGDCSVLLGIGLATSARDGIGLVHLDGHTDFRHPGNSDECASVAGEDSPPAAPCSRRDRNLEHRVRPGSRPGR